MRSTWMAAVLPLDTWCALAVLLAPIGFVLQDVAADAMTVAAVPFQRPDGSAYSAAEQQQMHVTMQTLGRMATVGCGTIRRLTGRDEKRPRMTPRIDSSGSPAQRSFTGRSESNSTQATSARAINIQKVDW